MNQDVLGLQARVVQHANAGYVLVKDIEQKRGKMRAVALYNPSDSICDFAVPINVLELSGKVKARDLVKQKDLPVIKETLKYKLPPHSVLILRVEGEKRLEPMRYEGEWAYLPCFNDLVTTPKNIVYAPMKEASEGMIVSYIGGKKENYAEWKEVYSEQGGNYEMTIHYIPRTYSKLEVTVNNDKTVMLNTLPDNGEKKLATISIPIHLKPGYNTVRMGSSYCWAPDIDCFTLTPSSL